MYLRDCLMVKPSAPHNCSEQPAATATKTAENIGHDAIDQSESCPGGGVMSISDPDCASTDAGNGSATFQVRHHRIWFCKFAHCCFNGGLNDLGRNFVICDQP